MLKGRLQIVKPENILTRAEKLLAVNRRDDALKVLHDFVMRPQFMQWTPQVHDKIVQQDLELCVEARNAMFIRDTLYQLKSVAVHVPQFSGFETAVRTLFKLLDDDCATAYKKVEDLVSTSKASAGAKAADAAAVFIMSSVSRDEEKERVLSASVLPHFHFFGEVMRAVLDVCKQNVNFLRMYEETTRHAFAFCRKYHRTEEFRVVSTGLRNQIGAIIEPTAERAARVTWPSLASRDVVEMLLRIRYDQFSTAMELGNYTDAYNALSGEMHRVFNAARVVPAPQNNANYYAGLAELFWISSNRLIHAKCLHAHFGVLMQTPAIIASLHQAEQHAEAAAVAANEEYKRPLLTAEDMHVPTAEELRAAATQCVLAALCAPVVREDKYSMYDPSTLNDKNRHISRDLGFASFFTRDSLLAALTKEALPLAADFAHRLYDLLQGAPCGDSVCADVDAVCQWILAPENAQPECVRRYVPFYRKLALLRLLQHRARLAQPIAFDDLVARTGARSWFDVQATVLEFARAGLVQVAIDPLQRTVAFPRPANEAAAELPRLLKRLSQLAPAVDATLAAPAVTAAQRDARIAKIRASVEREQELFARRREIQEQKAARHDAYLAILRQREEAAQARQREEAAAEAAERERAAREREAEQRRRQEAELKARAEQANQWAKRAEEERARLAESAKKAKEQSAAEKKAKELEGKIAALERDAEHFERAKRGEELAAMKKRLQEENARGRAAHDKAAKAATDKARAEYERLAEVKRRVDPIRAERDQFVQLVMGLRRAAFEKQMEEYNAKVAAAKAKWDEEQRKIREEKERKQREERERREREEKERREREEKERKEREERERKEREERERREEKERREREAREKELEEQRKAAENRYRPPALRGQSGIAQSAPASRFARDDDDDEGWLPVNSQGRATERRDRGYDRSRGGYDDRDRGYGDRDRDRGYGDRYGDRDRDRGYGDRYDDRDRYDRGYGDRDRYDRGYDDRDRYDRGYDDRDRYDRSRGYDDRDRDRDRGYGPRPDDDRRPMQSSGRPSSSSYVPPQRR